MRIRINEDIDAPEVRLLDSNGALRGVVSIADALARARAVGLDLVEVNPRAKPPVCKLIDMSRYGYDKG